LYFWSVATLIAPSLQIVASASEPVVSTEAQTPVPLDPLVPPVAALVVPLEQAAAMSAKTATSAAAPWIRFFRMQSLLPGTAEAARPVRRDYRPRRTSGQCTVCRAARRPSLHSTE